MTTRIEGVLFDKDGTLFDFEATWRDAVAGLLAMLAPGDRARQSAIGEAVGFSLETRRFTAGTPLVAGSVDDLAAALAPHVPGIDAQALERLGNAAARSMDHSALVPAAADLPALLQGMKARGLRLGVATHDSEAAARHHLDSVGALAPFDFIAGYDSGHGLKPGPGMVEAFARACGLPTGALVMVGDSVHDLGAGRAAGVALTVGVLTGPATEADLAPLADAVLPSIEHLPALLDDRFR
jgi:phosphoglycolate phosphatase